MISIKTEGLRPTVMKETPLSDPPLQTTTASSGRPPLAASAQVIKRSNLKKKKGQEEKTSLTVHSFKVSVDFGVSKILNSLWLPINIWHWQSIFEKQHYSCI